MLSLSRVVNAPLCRAPLLRTAASLLLVVGFARVSRAETPSPSELRFVDRGFVHAVERTTALDQGRLPRIGVRVAREDGRTWIAAVDPYAIVQIAEGTVAAQALLHHGLRGELLSRGARLWRVRGARPEAEDGLSLAARLSGNDRGRRFSMVVPNFHLPRHRETIDIPPDDPRYGGQWYLERIRIEEAWTHTTGRDDVTVVVIDNGCDLSHPDLVSKLDPGLDVLDRDDDPSFEPGKRGNTHGTACAGIVGAQTDNGVGISGSCPSCRVRCVRLLGGDSHLVPLDADIRAFEFAKNVGAAVVSNSWSFDGGVPVPGPLETVILDVIDNGRGGLGTTVVFAAGNENREVGADEIAAVRDVIAVGATTLFDEATSFSNRGRAVDIVAPAGTLTTDISGDDGDGPGDYTQNFGGTSSACPLVAGVAGLLMSARADVTASEVARAIFETARPAPFATPDATGHDMLYGFGIVAPGPAVRRILGLAESPDAGTQDDASTRSDASNLTDAGELEPETRTGWNDDNTGCSAVHGRTQQSRSISVLAAVAAWVWLRRRRSVQSWPWHLLQSERW